MASAHRHPWSSSRQPGEAAKIVWAAILAVLIVVSACPLGFAQSQPADILAPGNAAVTGFSSAPLPTQIAPGVNPADKTFIDLNGASLRIIDLRDMRGPPNAQLVNAPKPYVATAGQIG